MIQRYEKHIHWLQRTNLIKIKKNTEAKRGIRNQISLGEGDKKTSSFQ